MSAGQIFRKGWVRAVTAAIFGIALLFASQIFSEQFSRVGPYPVDQDLVLYLPGEDANQLENARRVEPEYSPVPAYAYDDEEKTGPGVFETKFEWRTGDPQPALLLAFFRRLDAVELNGQPVALQNLANQSLVSAWRPASLLLDEAHLVDGENTLRITDPGRSRKVLSAFAIVPVEAAQKAAFAGEFFELHLPLAVTGIMLFVALFCAFVSWPPEEKLQIRCFIALLLIWSLRNAMGFDLFGSIPSPWRIYVSYWIGCVLAGAFAAYCIAWSRGNARLIWGVWAIVAAGILLTVMFGRGDNYAAFQASYLAESTLVPVLVVAGVAFAIFAEARSENARPIQLLLIVGAGTAMVLDALDDRFDISLGLFDPQPMIYYATPRHGLLLAMGLFGAMVVQQIRARRLSEDLSGELNRRLRLREAELAETHSREKRLVRRQAFGEERQRIMRDMHDGLGSQLMGMLLAARRGKAEPERVADGLQQVIDEMRLMIDSMDSVGDSLATALAGFRNRLQPRIEDAGFDFGWDNQLGPASLSFPPRKSLQLFRIMQEAVTNALKHSGGSRIALTIKESDERTGWLEVTISDDGPGITGPRGSGHGLDNMRARAAKEGGVVKFGKGPGGLVTVLFPPDESNLAVSSAVKD